MLGKCPKCDSIIAHVNLKEVTINAPDANWTGVSYQCPLCHCVLSVGIDPVALKNELRDEILKAFDRH